MLFYKDYIMVANSLKSGSSPLNEVGEPFRVFRYQNGAILEEPPIGLPDNYAPTVSLVHNGRLYLGG